MIPMQYHQLAQFIHEERIRAAELPRGEWMDFTIRPIGAQPSASASEHVRIWLVHSLHRLRERLQKAERSLGSPTIAAGVSDSTTSNT